MAEPSTPLPEQGGFMAQSNGDYQKLRIKIRIALTSHHTGKTINDMKPEDYLVDVFKQHELDARIDEAEKFLAYDLFGTLQRIERTNDAVNRRIGELKAEREGL